jgi:hypothetical protein
VAVADVAADLVGVEVERPSVISGVSVQFAGRFLRAYV